MFLPAGRSFTIILLTLTCLAYGSQTTHPTASATSLSSLIPSCAADCVEQFISSDYPKDACSEADLDCLCRTNTTSGYTLGEAAFRCSLSLCSMKTVFSSDLYDICDSVPGALPRTHATITATVMPTGSSPTQKTATTTTGTVPSTSSSSSASDTGSGSSSSTFSQPTSFSTEHTSVITETFRSPLTVPTSQLPSTTTSSATSSGQSASASASDSRLEPAAVIGVSVASGISGFFIVGVIIFFCCRKVRRRKQDEKDHFFEIGGVMSEPPDFTLPPRRPTGPRPMPGTTDRDSETSRLITPFEPRAQTPAVVVTGPGNHHNDSPMGVYSADRIGFALTSNSEAEGSLSQSSPRTISDLLPDKPTLGLYPEPLRLSRQKQPRPHSHATLFEEDMTRPRSAFGAPYQNLNQLTSSSRAQDSRRYNRAPMAGLPAHPRAMLHGFGEGQDGKLAMRGPNYRKRPTYAESASKVQASNQDDTYESLLQSSPISDAEEFVDRDRQQRGAGHVRLVGPPSSQGVASGPFRSTDMNNSMLYNLDDNFEDIDINGSTSRLDRESRHSGNLRPLTPVREIRTPTRESPTPNWELVSSDQPGLPRMPFSRAVSPRQEIVSRPRIVRRDDIKRVQIRRKPHAGGLSAPYSPEDYWLGHDPGPVLETQTRRQSTDSLRSVASVRGHMPKRKPVPYERNVTPSRSGSDLILRVD
ncbi:uncharacterized protein AKAW2_10693A [Aspergillus luchuensis]|uniref:Uncharacterized protein n=2 Tax=Aspergillus kawachii TaxID=1069201 RepID=A0A7R7ZUK6_ASPKA|nr:uncharacterized protein AKAW2_10693A [Aspergillus luchuensis]BCR93647.1 hypothetical protein AKAW2_10693A [Aspergillus luchuensis]BCS06277.1 hypothetical protein ALUC_10658A [Aspergillus luchuensis]